MVYNLAAIRQLLNDAFSSGEIKTLAFDRFQEVYNDFAAGMSKSQMIEAVVENAHKNGRIPDLLDYVKKENPYQYNQYAPQLEAAPLARQPAFGDGQRLQDLQRNIDREADLLNKYNNSTPSTLPPQPFFFGRQKELASIAGAISPEARTWGALIDGPGGIGKTALAVRSGHLAPAANFERKIFLSAKIRELTPKGEQKLEDFMLPNYMALLAELARELGDETLAQHAPNERANAVRRALADVRVLIIIDNLETFAEAERDRLYQFLSRLPLSCKAIVTSRRRSDIDARIVRLDRLAGA